MTVQAENMVADGDPAFYRVDTRTPAHQLPKGVLADAVNKRFEDGRAWPRFGVTLQPWGMAGINLLAGQQWSDSPPHPIDFYTVNLVIGQKYTYIQGDTLTMSTGVMSAQDSGGFYTPTGTIVPPGEFIATANLYYLRGDSGVARPTTAKMLRNGNLCAYLRFSDPNGFDTTVLATDDWRDQAGEDGGRGRVWRIQSGNAPVQVSLNGDDIYGVARFVSCFNGLVLLRQDNERHYFSAAAVAANVIQLNSEATWQDGDQVFIGFDLTANSQINGSSAPAANSFCFVKDNGNNQVKLYADSGLTQQLIFATATGRFYLEWRGVAPGFYGLGAPPLLAQPDADGRTLWEVGFEQVPVNLQVTNTVAATGVWTVPNHRLIPGDAVTLSGMPGGHTPANGNYFAYPLNDHQLQLFDTQTDALLAANGSTAGLEVVSNDGENAPVMVKGGASGLPMPPAREGYYTDNNQLVLVNGEANILISDPLDPLHYTPMSASLTANLGDSDPVTAIGEITGSDTLIFGKTNSILALYNFSEGPASWLLRSVTREYGCVAPLSMRQWGNSLMFLSRRGLDRVEVTAFGVIVGTPKPVSYDLQKYVNLIDWNNASLAVVETWNNRLFLAYPAKGQAAGDAVNNSVLSLNFLNTNLAKGDFGWEGAWSGPALQVFGFARLDVYGDERLTFVDYSGNVCWLDDGHMDYGLIPVADSMTTRIYTGGAEERKIWNQMLVVWDTNNPLLTVTAAAPGYNEADVLSPAGGFSYDRTKYAAGEGPDYNPATQVPPFNNPYRQDYSLAGAGELIGGQPDVLQNTSEPFRMREDDWGVQIVIANSRGECRVRSVSVKGFMGPSSDRSRV